MTIYAFPRINRVSTMPISVFLLSVDMLRLSPITNTQPSGTVLGPMKSSLVLVSSAI